MRLADILEHADIAVDLAGAKRLDVTRRLALERALFIIGEAASALTEGTRDAIDQPWTDIIGLRNVLAHQYQSIDEAQLLQIARRQVPALAAAIRSHLG